MTKAAEPGSGPTYVELLQQVWQEIQRPSDKNRMQRSRNEQPSYQTLLHLLAFCSLRNDQGDNGPAKNRLEQRAELPFAQRLQQYRSVRRRAAELLGCRNDERAPERDFRDLLAAFLSGVPLAYLFGFEDFANYTFATGPGVLVPREDSEILLDVAQEFCRESSAANSQQQLRALELCCGTACISLSLYLNCIRECPGFQCWASDISAEALTYAEQNWAYWLKLCNETAGGPVRAGDFTLCQSDLLQSRELKRKYHLIFANPPYLSLSECQRRSDWCEPMLALEAGVDGFAVLQRIVEDTPHYLRPGGALMLEAAPWQMQQLQGMLQLRGGEQIQRHRDGAGLERVIVARFWLGRY